MPSTTRRLVQNQIIRDCPGHVTEGIQYETMVGSEAYGCSSGESDTDIKGWCIPSKDMLFPHLRGEIEGFGSQKQKFNQFIQHGINDPSAMGGHGRVYDIEISSITKMFTLLAQNNPNSLDVLYVPQRCILFQTPLGELLRMNRKLFLHKGSYYKHKGYAFSQLSKIQSRDYANSKRKESIEKWGYDLKHAYHLVRLLSNAEQILMEGDLDLEKDREMLKSIRRGEWTLDEIKDFFNRKEKQLDNLYLTSTLQHSADEGKLKNLLFDILEQHFGSLEKCIVREDEALRALEKIDEICQALRTKGVL